MYRLIWLALHFIVTSCCWNFEFSAVFNRSFPDSMPFISILRHSRIIFLWSLGPIFLQKLPHISWKSPWDCLLWPICGYWFSYRRLLLWSFLTKISSPWFVFWHLHLLPFCNMIYLILTELTLPALNDLSIPPVCETFVWFILLMFIDVPAPTGDFRTIWPLLARIIFGLDLINELSFMF